MGYRTLSILTIAMMCILFVASPAMAQSVRIENIDPGARYYINNILRENDLVVVRRFDRSRGLVKVLFPSGAVDWVSPSKLLTRTESRTTDTGEAVVGAALVAGALWAIIDPDGFQDAMSNERATRPTRAAPTRSRQATQPAARAATTPDGTESRPLPIAAMPFAPIAPGAWQDASDQDVWTRWANGFIESELGQPERRAHPIEKVRLKSLSFYREGGRQASLVEMIVKDGRGAYYAMVVPGSTERTLLTSSGTSIHAFNQLVPPSIDSAESALQYLRFFTSSIAGEDGIFLCVDSRDEFLSKSQRDRMRLTRATASRDAAGGWRVRSHVVYGNALFRASFRVQSNGTVEMLEDTPLMFVRPQYTISIKGSRRFYTRPS